MEFPITRATLNLTRNCNLRCKYPCFTFGCKVGDMSEDIAYRSIDFLFKNALQSGEKEIEVGFWGGEPLLKWQLLQNIVLYAKEKSAQTAVNVNFSGTTNGTLLTKDKFDFLEEHKIYFMVSIDGTKETHDKYRVLINGEGSHDIIMKNMRDVLDKWPFSRARMSPTADNIHRFYMDVKYLFDFGFQYLMFSPAYESGFTDEHWKIWENECYKVVDLLVHLKKQGKSAEIEHFNSYTAADDSKWPCGAGRFYVGIDIDGAIYPCHRFNKFNDNRPWQEKKVCIGHIDSGITNPTFRNSFIDFNPACKKECSYAKVTPCHGGCYAVNFDFNNDITKPYTELCNYVEMQKKVSTYYVQQLTKAGLNVQTRRSGSCICNFEFYTGPVEQPRSPLTLEIVALLLADLNNRVSKLEGK